MHFLARYLKHKLNTMLPCIFISGQVTQFNVTSLKLRHNRSCEGILHNFREFAHAEVGCCREFLKLIGCWNFGFGPDPLPSLSRLRRGSGKQGFEKHTEVYNNPIQFDLYEPPKIELWAKKRKGKNDSNPQ